MASGTSSVLSAGQPETADPASVLDRVEDLRAANDLENALGTLLRIDRSRLDETETLRCERLRQDLLHQLRRWEQASATGRAWLDLALAWDDPRSVDEVAKAAIATSRSDFARSRFGEALEVLETALALGPFDSDVRLELMLRASRALSETAEIDRSLELLEQAEELARDQPKMLVRVLREQAVAHLYRGDGLTSVELQERSIGLAEQNDLENVSVSYVNLAQAYQAIHDYAGCIETLSRMESTGLSEDGAIIRLATLGICLLELNRLDQAEDALLEAKSRASEIGDESLEGWALGELGIVATEQDNEGLALQRFDKAIEVARSTNNVRDEIVWWMNVGRLHRDRERYAQALAAYEQAERLYARAPDLEIDPNLYKHLGQSHAGLGRDDLAEPLFERALAEAKPDSDSKVRWETHRELARLYLRTDRRDQALASYTLALDAVEWMRSGLRLSQFKADFFEDKVKLYEEVMRHVLDAEAGDSNPGLALEVAERAKARAFLDGLVEIRADVARDLPAELIERERHLQQQISQAQGKLRRGVDRSDVDRDLRAAEAELESLLLRVRSEYPRFYALRNADSVRLEALRLTLRPDEALLLYFLGEVDSHAWLVRADELHHRHLGDRSLVDELVRRAYTELVDPASELVGVAALARHVLAPFEPQLRDVEQLIIVPDGPLYYFPFEVLPTSTGQWLGDLVTTSYAPSASTLVELRTNPTPTGEPALLALGDAEYGDQSGDHEPEVARSAAMNQLRHLGALPHTRREVDDLVGVFGDSSLSLTGEDANEIRFKSLDHSRFTLLHFATHGWIDPISPARSGLVLAEDSTSAEDGILQTREILGLRLEADLVTLSACRSGLGELVTGEGMVGIARSFFYAGTDSVVASLWNVNDRASADFMRFFYGALGEGKSKAASLQEARRELRESSGYEHPYYWAPWILLGRGEDGVDVPDVSQPLVGWELVTVGLLLFGLLSLVLVRIRGLEGR